MEDGRKTRPAVRALYPPLLLASLFVRSVLAFLAAELLQFEPIGAARLFVRPVVAIPASRAFQPNIFPHDVTSRLKVRDIGQVEAEISPQSPRRVAPPRRSNRTTIPGVREVLHPGA